MKLALLALTALVALPTAAIACSCVDTKDPAELREFAGDAVRGAVALVEVEAMTSYDVMKDEGEKVRVVRTLAGKAPESFQVTRRRFASGATCDDVFSAGDHVMEALSFKPRLVILYPEAGSASYRISSLCTNLLLEKPTFRDEVAARIGQTGERG